MSGARFLITLFLLSLGTTMVGQEKKEETKKKRAEIQLIHADRFTRDATTPKGASKLKGDVQLRHEDALMYCDSAYLYEKSNSLDAFGHVRIVEGDSLNLTGDSLFYDGDKRVAKIRGRVKIDDGASVLTTNFLDYYRDSEMGHYYGGGTIDSKKEKTNLTSKIGYYYTNTKTFHFKKDVVMKHPDYTIVTDTMQYAPDREKTWFFGPTNIDSEERHIYCELGWFDQLKDEAVFIKNARIQTESQIMEGDTIEYDEAKKIGIGKCNVVMIDTAEKFEVEGDYARYEEEDSTSFMTKNLLMKQDMDGDTFFLTADTLYTYPDTNGKRVLKTYHHVRFFKSDMQGACDSLMYLTSDSIIYMYRDPILWSDDNQLTADSIHMTMKGGALDKMYMNLNAFIISKEDTNLYNQIKGRNMVGYFKDQDLHKVDVFLDGETVYYPREEDSTLIGVNKTECMNMTIRIDSNQIDKITFYDKPVAKLTPSDDMPMGGIILEGFIYRIAEKPLSPGDLLRRED